MPSVADHHPRDTARLLTSAYTVFYDPSWPGPPPPPALRPSPRRMFKCQQCCEHALSPLWFPTCGFFFGRFAVLRHLPGKAPALTGLVIVTPSSLASFPHISPHPPGVGPSTLSLPGAPCPGVCQPISHSSLSACLCACSRHAAQLRGTWLRKECSCPWGRWGDKSIMGEI